jgi:hypothetical protein
MVYPALLPTIKTCDKLASSMASRELRSKIRQFHHHCFHMTLNCYWHWKFSCFPCYDIWYDISVNCNCVDTRWQEYSTHLHTKVRAVPCLCKFYPGICLTNEEKARKNVRQGSQRVLLYIIPKRTHHKTHTYTHTHTHTHIIKSTHTHTHTLQNPHTHPHITRFFLPCGDIFKLRSTYLLKIIHSLSAHAHSSAVSSRLNWHPRRFKWTRPLRWKTKSGFCACAITFRTSYTKRAQGGF